MTFPQTSAIVWQSVEKKPENDDFVLILYAHSPSKKEIFRGLWDSLAWRNDEWCSLDSQYIEAWAEMPQLPE